MYIGHKNFGYHNKLGQKLLTPPNIFGQKHSPSKRNHHHHHTIEPFKEKHSDLEKHHQRIRDNLHRH
jgi:hypothetical protein